MRKWNGGLRQPQHRTAEPEGPGSSESPKVGMRLTAVNSKPTGEELLAEYPQGTQVLRMEQCGECLEHQPQDVSSSKESEVGQLVWQLVWQLLWHGRWHG